MQVESLKWMISLGLLNDPQVKNHILLNIYNVDPRIKDVQMLMDLNKQKLLIHVDLSWWSRKFHQSTIIDNINIRLNEMIPNYQFRVINDLDLFNKALEKTQNK